MRSRRMLALLIAVVAGSVAFVPGAVGGREAAVQIRICYANAATNYAPMWIAWKEGFFAQEGLDVSVFQASGRGSQILQSGDCQISLDSAVPNIIATARGANFVMVGAEANRFGFKLVARTDRGINRVTDLRGKKLAVSAPQAAVDQAGRALLKQFGLQPGRDVEIVSIPSIASRLAALSSGTVDAMIASPPVAQLTKDGKAKDIYDLSSLRFVLVADWMKRDYAQNNPAVVKGFLRSIIRANRWLKNPRNKAGAIKYIGEVTGISDPVGLNEAYDYEFKVHQDEPVISPIALRNSLRYVEENFNLKVDQYDFLYLRPLEQVLTYSVNGVLTARPEVPRPRGAARSRAAFQSTLKQNGELRWSLTMNRLTGRATAAHLHVGAPGKAGPVRLTLCRKCKVRNSGTARIGSGLSKAIKAGQVYVNVHTARNPAGEVRAQLVATPGR